MAVNQTECYRVVTIGYLKSFIGTNVQNSANGSTISISRTDDTYCHTYSELTGGTIIQTWSQGNTPNGDRDGITVNSAAVLGGNYANNQLVDQRDLGLKYTRFKSFSVSSASSVNSTIRSIGSFYGSGGGWSGSFDSSSYSVSGYGTKTITITLNAWR